MAASGFAGLGYQIVWTQQTALWLGHETAAVMAVVTAFFGGLALGALALGSRIDRSPRPARWYAGCEVVIALWSLALAFGLGRFSAAVLYVIDAEPSPAWQWTVAFAATFVALAPATLAMGATLPAMERLVARFGRSGGGDYRGEGGSEGRSRLAALYAGNTLGAVVGVLAAAFWLVPRFGLTRTAAVCAACNVFCAVAALALGRADRGAAGPVGRDPAPPPAAAGGEAPSASASAAFPTDRMAPPVQAAAARSLAVLAATGLLGIGYEVLVVRVVSQVAENTVYTFALLLAIYLVGTALGAAAWQRRVDRAAAGDADDEATQRDRLLQLLAAACLVGSVSLWAAERLRDGVQQALASFDLGMTAPLVAEAAVALAAFGLPTLAMGALFSHLGTRAREAGIGFGRALGANTLGAAAAAPLFGVALLPAFGAKAALLLVVAGYLGLLSRRAWTRPAAWGAVAATLAVVLVAPPLVFVDVPEGGRVVSYREGATSAVSVVEDAQGVARLRIDNRQQEGSSATRLADARQALLPLLLHPAPRRALFLGLGTGVTASAAAEDPTLEVDVAELLPEVIAASEHFRREPDAGASAPRVHIVAADARRFVRATDVRYDIVVADNFHPARSGSGSLYTVEHFAAVRDRLARGGVFCQWLPLHQLDLATLRSIVRAFVAVHPDGSALLATNSLETPVLGLVALAGGGRFDVAALRERQAALARSVRLSDYGLEDDLALFGSFVAGPAALARFAGDAVLNTDDHPVVAYMAPRITYAPDSLPRDRLMALLGELRVEPADVIDAGADAAWSRRLTAYRSARNRFLGIGRDVRPTTDPRAMLAQVREPLLSVLRISPDFRPAYDPLLRMARALSRTDRAGAQALLDELSKLRPTLGDAGRLLANPGTP